MIYYLCEARCLRYVWLPSVFLLAPPGFLYYIGETYNFTTAAVCILSVGLCVDYSVHIMHTFLHSRGTPNQRVAAALIEIGPSVLQGGITSLLGVILCLAGGSKTIQMFGVMSIMVVVFGQLQGLIMLPIMLTGMGRLITMKAPTVGWPTMGFFAVPVIFTMQCAWCFSSP